jgi:hypothetical protein
MGVQNQLVSLRIKELKDVLSRLGLPKQGKKQVLMEKIMGVIAPAEVLPPKVKGLKMTKNAISREEAATIVNDMYRKVQRSVAPDLASAVRSSNNIGGSSSLAHSDEQDEVVGRDEAKTRCPCGNTVDTGTMIQCDSRTCGVWQHMNCVVISDKPSEGVKPEIPSSFYCDLCRITHCDPFCVALSHPLLPTKLTTSFSKMEGSNPLQNVEKSFTLTRGDRDLLLKKDTDLQVNALSSLVSHPRGFICMHQKCIVLPLFLMLSNKEKESQSLCVCFLGGKVFLSLICIYDEAGSISHVPGFSLLMLVERLLCRCGVCSSMIRSHSACIGLLTLIYESMVTSFLLMTSAGKEVFTSR